MQVQTLPPTLDTSEKSSIRDFRRLFIQGKNITPEILEEQKKKFGFSLFMLRAIQVSDAIKIAFQASKRTLIRNTNIFTIPHSYVFGGIILGIILGFFHISFLFLPLFFGLLILAYTPVFLNIFEKIRSYKESRIFFDIGIEEARDIQEKFFSVSEGIKKESRVYPLKMRLFLFLFGQPFIFLHLQFFGNLNLLDLFIFDIILFLVVFGLFEKFLFLFFEAFYRLYFWLYDSVTFLFPRIDQTRDFFLDLYELGTEAIENIDTLEWQMTRLKKDAIIDPDIGTTLGASIQAIGNMVHLVEKNHEFLAGNTQFRTFLIELIDEILLVYSHVFDFMEVHIQRTEKDLRKSTPGSTDTSKALDAISRELIEQKKGELTQLKEKILDMRIQD